MRWFSNVQRRLVVERGFTLVELMATMAAAMVVMLALGVIMQVTLKQTTRSFSMVDAAERARPVFEQIENELHSGCFADEQTPIQAGSNGNALIFMTAYGNGATPTAVWHEIDYNPSPTSTLTDTTYSTAYSVVGGIPTWSRGARQSSKILLTNVAQNATTPVFQYFAYQTAPGTDQSGNQYMILPDGTAPVPGTSTTVPANPLAPGSSLSTAQAASAAEVLISLMVGPTGHSNQSTTLNVAQTVNDQIVFRFTPAANHVGGGATFNPCD